MQLEPAFVRLLDGEREGIPRRLRRATLPSSEKYRPRFQSRREECVGPRPDLENDCVELERHGAIEDGQQLSLLIPCRQSGLRWPIDVPDGGDPDRAKLAADWGRLLRDYGSW